MTKFIKTVFLLILILGIQKGYSQVYKFQTTGFSVLEKNSKGKWGKWSDLKMTSVIISLDTNKNRIIVYSQEMQLYQILNYEELQENDNDEIYIETCLSDLYNNMNLSCR